MGFFTDFKAFLMKGEIVTLATAVFVGGAFGKIVTSFTNDVLMPPIGLLLGKVDFSDLKIVLQEGIPAVEENGFTYGKIYTGAGDFSTPLKYEELKKLFK